MDARAFARPSVIGQYARMADVSDMSDVDASDKPTAHVAYLNAAAEVFRERRVDSYRMLDLQEGHRFLDVGCGAGEVIEDVAAIVGSSGTVSGIDMAQTMVDESQSRLAAAGVVADVRQADAHALPFGERSFDRVRCERVLQHVENPAEVVAEIFRVLAPGGMALLIDANHEQADIATDDVGTWRVARQHSTGRVRHQRAGLHLAEWMEAAGFSALVVTAAALMLPWPNFRSGVLIDEGAERAIAKSELDRDRWQAFVTEQDERYRLGTGVSTVLGYRCLGTKSEADRA
jgi:ubiquinone/menaquinone biosynthesis C-methylase UbiE